MRSVYEHFCIELLTEGFLLGNELVFFSKRMGHNFGTPLAQCVNRTFLKKERLVNNPSRRNRKRLYIFLFFFFICQWVHI